MAAAVCYVNKATKLISKANGRFTAHAPNDAWLWSGTACRTARQHTHL